MRLKRVYILIAILFYLHIGFASYKVDAEKIISPGTITETLLSNDVQDKLDNGGSGGSGSIKATTDLNTFYTTEIFYFKDNFKLNMDNHTAEIKLNPYINSNLYFKNLYLNYDKYIGDFNIIDDFDYGIHNEWLPYKGSFPSDRNTLLRCVDDATYYGYKVKYYDLNGDGDLWTKFEYQGSAAFLLDPEILPSDANTLEITFTLNVGDAQLNANNYSNSLSIYFKKTNEVNTGASNYVCYTTISMQKATDTSKIKIYTTDLLTTLYVDPNSDIHVAIRLNRNHGLLDVYINNTKMSSQSYTDYGDNIQQIWFSRNSNYWKDIYINDLKVHYYNIYPQEKVSIKRLIDYAGSSISLLTFSTNEIKLGLPTSVDTLEVANIISNDEIINIAKDIKINDINIKSNIILNYQEDLGFTDNFESGVAGDSLTDSEYLSSDGIYDTWQYKSNSPVYTDEAALSSNLAITGSNNALYKAIFIKRKNAITKEVIFSFDAKVEAGHTYLCHIIFDSFNFKDNGTNNGVCIETYIYTDTGNGRVRIGNSYIDSAVDITDGQFHRYTYIINHAEHSFDLYVDNVYCGQTSITSSYNQTKAFKIEFDSYNTIIDNVSFFEKMEQKSSIKCITNNGEKNVIQPINDIDAKSDFRLIPYRLTIPVLPSAPDNPITGEIYFDTSANVIKVYDGSTWH